MRRVLARVEHESLDRRARARVYAALDRVELRERPVLVVLSLNEEHGYAHVRQIFFEVPLAKLRIEPRAVPSPERAVDVAMVFRQARAKIAVLVRVFRARDAGDRDVLAE